MPHWSSSESWTIYHRLYKISRGTHTEAPEQQRRRLHVCRLVLFSLPCNYFYMKFRCLQTTKCWHLCNNCQHTLKYYVLQYLIKSTGACKHLPFVPDAAASVGVYGWAGGKCDGLLLCISMSGRDLESPTVTWFSCWHRSSNSSWLPQ